VCSCLILVLFRFVRVFCSCGCLSVILKGCLFRCLYKRRVPYMVVTMGNSNKVLGELQQTDHSGGVSGRVDAVLEQEFGISRELIKQLPVSSLDDVAKKARVLQEYLVLKRVQGDLLLRHGHTANLLLNELADLEFLQAQREAEILLSGTSPLADRLFMENKDRIINILLALQKLGIDSKRLDLEEKKAGLNNDGVAFTVAGNSNVIVDKE
jgi:hypothetical protein